MKPKLQISRHLTNIFQQLVVLLICLTLTQNVQALSRMNIPLAKLEFKNVIVFDDSTTTEFGDTVAVVQDGGDTIFIIEDAIDSLYAGRTVDIGDIVVSLSSQQMAVPKGTYGVNLENFFNPNHASIDDNDEYVTTPDPWEYLIDLAPQVLRVPGGASTKFLHPFGSMNPDNGTPFANLMNGGAGVLLEDIITFYDATNDMDYPLVIDVYNDCIDGIYSGSWIDPNEVGHFMEEFDEWLTQPHFDPTLPEYEELYNQPLYINQFIDLVKRIEEANPGLTVKVLWVANIFTEPVYDIIKTVEYLQSATLNNNYGVTVYGVELGNECYFDIYDKLIGFGCYEDHSNFDHYWAYVNGVEDYNAHFFVTDDFDLDDVLVPTGMTGIGAGEVYQKHDYSGASVPDYLNLFPLPSADVVANPNLTQNPGY